MGGSQRPSNRRESANRRRTGAFYGARCQLNGSTTSIDKRQIMILVAWHGINFALRSRTVGDAYELCNSSVS